MSETKVATAQDSRAPDAATDAATDAAGDRHAGSSCRRCGEPSKIRAHRRWWQHLLLVRARYRCRACGQERLLWRRSRR